MNKLVNRLHNLVNLGKEMCKSCACYSFSLHVMCCVGLCTLLLCLVSGINVGNT